MFHLPLIHPLFWPVILILDVIALVKLFGSSADGATKAVWTIVILLLPLFGMILYFLIGPGRKKAV